MSERIFVTGGASGLGRAIAQRFARDGARVCIGDVNPERMRETEGLLPPSSDAFSLHCDVTRDEDVEAAKEALVKRWGGVDVVVNNAGVAQAGPIEATSIDDWRWIIDINLLGVVRGCRTFTPLFKEQRRGHFVNIASMAGLLDVPYMSSYNATKAAVVSLSETLQNELHDDGIGVSVVCPSFFQTNLTESLRTNDPGFRATMAKLLAKSAITADDVADDVFRAVKSKTFYVLSHREGRAAWTMKRLLPRRLYATVIRKQTAGMKKSALG